MATLPAPPAGTQPDRGGAENTGMPPDIARAFAVSLLIAASWSAAAGEREAARRFVERAAEVLGDQPDSPLESRWRTK